MRFLYKYLKNIAIFIGILLIMALAFSILSYFKILGAGVKNVMAIVLMVVTFLYFGFRYGKSASEKGYIEGIKIGLLLILILILINILFYRTGFSLERFIYYIVLILSSILGSMIGINKKKD